MNLTTLDEVKCLLDDLDTGFDAEIALRISAISARAATFCNRSFEQKSYVEIHCGGTHRLYIDNPPVISVTSIIWDDFLDFSNGYTFPSNEYKAVNRGNEIAYITGDWPGHEDSLQVTYVGGYLPPTDPTSLLPKDLQHAVAQQVVYELRHRKDFGLRDVDFPSGRIEKVTDQNFILPVRQALQPYRIPQLG